MIRLRRIGLILGLISPILVAALLGVSVRPRLSPKTSRQIQVVVDSLASGQEPDGRLAEALLSPWRGDLWEMAGAEAFSEGRPQETIRFYMVAATIKDLSPDSHTIMGDAFLELGDLQGAIESWEMALQKGEGNEHLYQRLASTHLSIGDYSAAGEAYRSLAVFRPGDPDTLYQLGLIELLVAPELASDSLTKAAEFDPSLTEDVRDLLNAITAASIQHEDLAIVKLALGRQLAAIDEWEFAAEAFKQAINLRPDYAESWAFYGEAKRHLDQDGLAELQKAYRLDPESIAVNSFLAFYWQEQERYDLAVDHLKTIIEAEPDHPTLLMEYARTVARHGDIQSALEIFLHAISLDPENPVLWRLLARFSIGSDIQVEKIGLPAARQAFLLDRKDPVAIDLIGQAHMVLGDTLSAERFFYQAVEIEPTFAPAYLHLGLLYIATGRSNQAYENLMAVLDLAPDTTIANHAQQAISQYFP